MVQIKIRANSKTKWKFSYLQFNFLNKPSKEKQKNLIYCSSKLLIFIKISRKIILLNISALPLLNKLHTKHSTISFYKNHTSPLKRSRSLKNPLFKFWIPQPSLKHSWIYKSAEYSTINFLRLDQEIKISVVIESCMSSMT